MGKLIIDGNSVYEVDEECVRKKETEKKKEQSEAVKDRTKER